MKHSKILIADDEPFNLTLFAEMLKPANYKIITANGGAEAIEIARCELPDLIILDWNMPETNGLEALKTIKDQENMKDIPVIMISGIMTSSSNLMEAMNEGATDFIRKPFDKIELLARVKSMLRLSHSIRELNEKYLTIENSNRFIHSLIEGVPHPLVYYNLDGTILGCNQLFEELLGHPVQRIKGTSVYLYCHPSLSRIHQMEDMLLIRDNELKSYEGKTNPDGKDYIFSKNIFHNLHGTPEGILCIMTDVSEIKKAHHEIVESKKRELTSSALRLIQISELNNNLIAELEKLNSIAGHGAVENQIKDIINQYQANSGKSFWKEFESRFENVHEVFYNKLNLKFPGLTPGEKKLCALLRLNLSSKDIASITFQNSQSIDMARYRLRKKLNLQPDENLVDFLMKLDC